MTFRVFYFLLVSHKRNKQQQIVDVAALKNELYTRDDITESYRAAPDAQLADRCARIALGHKCAVSSHNASRLSLAKQGVGMHSSAIDVALGFDCLGCLLSRCDRVVSL